MDGYTACSMIKENEVTKEIPVLMLTSLAGELNKTLAQTIGADGYITKPFKSRELVENIKRWW